MQLMMSYGLVGPDGRPTMAPPDPSPAATTPKESKPSLIVPGQPQQTAAADSSGEKKSKLWVPGMD